MLMESPHMVTFLIGPGKNPQELATFETDPTKRVYTCFNNEREICIEIKIYDQWIKLEEYFYSNKSPCFMKPIPGTRDPRHRLYLNDMLEYIATIHNCPLIKVEDESSKAIGNCPNTHVRILKLAGHRTFYEKIGRFENRVMDERYAKARQQPVTSDLMIRLAQHANIKVTPTETFGTLAEKIILQCGGDEADEKKRQLLSDLIQTTRSLATRWLLPLFPPRRWDDDDYEKTVSLKFEHIVEHSMDDDRYTRYLHGPLYKYVRVIIRRVTSGGTKKRRSFSKKKHLR